MTRHQKCGNCRFVEILKPLTEGNTVYAECHKAAPTPSPDDSSAWWPIEPLDSPKAWCGDFAETDEVVEKREEARAKRWAELMGVHGRIPPTPMDMTLCGRALTDSGQIRCKRPRGHHGPCSASR